MDRSWIAVFLVLFAFASTSSGQSSATSTASTTTTSSDVGSTGGASTTGATTENSGGGGATEDPNFCLDKPNGFYENPNNCRKYYECENTLTIPRTCPNIELYRGNAVCDLPQRVECGDRPVCDDNNENCFEHHITTTPRPGEAPCLNEDVECNGLNDGDYFPVDPCSADYCICTNGDAVGRECPPGTVFNPGNNACDFPDNVAGC